MGVARQADGGEGRAGKVKQQLKVAYGNNYFSFYLTSLFWGKSGAGQAGGGTGLAKQSKK